MKKVIVAWGVLLLVCLACNDNAIDSRLAGQYNILDYGAKKDTAFLSTEAINRAVRECSAKGGGKVIVPPGNYKSGTIVLKDNVELHLAQGACIYASTDTIDFPRQAQPAYRSQKDPGGWYALIYAEKATNISLTGKGAIDGQGALQHSRPNAPAEDQDGRPRNILFISCKNISVSDIYFYNSGIWNQHYLDCEDVSVDNIRVFNHSNRNNDGIDIDGCRRFILSNSIIDSDDDGIVLKSTGAAPCEDIVVNNCIVSSHTNAIKCGTESTGGFQNITISNCVVKPTRSTTETIFRSPKTGITGISLELVDGGEMNGVSINNIVIEGTECPLYVRLGNRARKHTENAPEPPVGTMKNIQISNIVAYGTNNYTSSITGVPAGKIKNIYLNNIRFFNKGGLQASEYLPDYKSVIEDEKGYPQPNVWGNLPGYGLFIRHVENVSINNASFEPHNPDPRIPVIAVDVDYLQLKNISVDKSRTATDVLLHGVKKYDVDNTLRIKVDE